MEIPRHHGLHEGAQVAQPFDDGLKFRLSGADVDFADPNRLGPEVRRKRDEAPGVKDALAQEAPRLHDLDEGPGDGLFGQLH